MVDLDADQPAEKRDAEDEAADRPGQARAEGEQPAMVAHATQTMDGGEPRAREGAHVNPVSAVVLEIV
jgi:hypothetical protein